MLDYCVGDTADRKYKDYIQKIIWCIKTYIIAYVKIKKMKIYYPLCQTYSPTWFTE